VGTETSKRLNHSLVPALWLLCMPATLWGQDLQNFEPTVGQSGGVITPGVATTAKGEWVPSLSVGFGDQPVVSREPNSTVNHVYIDRQTGMDIGLAWGVTERLELGLNMPFGHVRGPGLASEAGEGMALGDLKATAKWRLMTNRIHGAGISASLGFVMPTGNPHRFYGSNGFGIEPNLILGTRAAEALLLVRAGLRFRTEKNNFENVDLGNEFVYSAAAIVDLDWSALAIVSELFGSMPLSQVSDAQSAFPLEGLLGLRFKARGSQVTFGSGFGLNPDRGVPNHRVFISVSYNQSANKDGPRPVPFDDPNDVNQKVSDVEAKPAEVRNLTDKVDSVDEATDGEEHIPDTDETTESEVSEVEQPVDGEDEPQEPEAEKSVDEASDTETSETEDTEDGAPEDGTPEDGAPEADAPEDDAPEDGAPEDGAPEADAPEDGAPEDGAPEDGAPEDGTPEADAPEADAPEDGAPEADAPEADAPEADAPEAVTALTTGAVTAPEPRGTKLDMDGDGVPDAQDACRTDPEDRDGFDDDDGCPDTDNDEDGTPDENDACPNEAGVANQRADANGCPAQTGDVKPPSGRAKQDGVVDYSGAIRFAPESGTLTRSSKGIIKNLVKTLKESAGDKLVCVDGYAFVMTTKKRNVTLSARRASVVHDYLISQGMSEEQVVFAGRGYGNAADRAQAVGDGLIRFRLVKSSDAPYQVKEISSTSENALTFSFELGRGVSKDSIEVATDGPSVLLIRFHGAQVDRSWAELSAPQVKRALLHPSSEAPPAGVLRVRMKKAMPEGIADSIKIDVQGNKVEVSVPEW
jgi:outer membrane protein OmpA-like peptidoglycan-associated protein